MSASFSRSTSGWPGMLGVPSLPSTERCRRAGRAVHAGLNVFGFFAVALLSGSLADGCGVPAPGSSARRPRSPTCRPSTSMSSTACRAGSSPPTARADSDVQPRGRSHHRPFRAVGRRAPDRRRAASCRPVRRADLDGGLGARRGRRIETPYRTADGRRIELGFTATHLADAGGHAGLLFTFQDVTDIKKLERDAHLRQRLAAVGEMAAGIAHEIRNPLASMSGSIQILRQELPLSAEQAQLMDIVLRESERLNDDDPVVPGVRPAAAVLDRAARRPPGAERYGAAAAEQRRGARGAHHRRRGSADEVAFEADEKQIRQIVWNLATNGLRAMRRAAG